MQQLNSRTELIGIRFGKLVITGPGVVRGNTKRTFWECQCDCGRITNVRESLLLLERTISCGCLKGQRVKSAKNPELAQLRDRWSKAAIARYYMYKYAAKDRDLEFKLSEEDFERITSQFCWYCGKAPENVAKPPRRDKLTNSIRSRPFIYNGIDRVDSLKGYTLDNVVACCKWCNLSKRERTVEEFLDQARRICRNHGHAKIF
jgi:hypothetical protein